MRSASALLLLAIVGGCATNRPSSTAPPNSYPPVTVARPDRVKIGQRYSVMGHWYTPSDDHGYDVTGVASWYGPGFHALATASGERYDQDAISAAHKTLPMPSFVEVTNLDNGRMLTVRINDRGPFVDGRIIDLSRKSAQLLGVDRPGTAHVRVRRVFPDAQQLASLTPSALPPSPPPRVDLAPAAEAIADATPGTIYIQVAAVSDAGRAAWLKAYLMTFAPSLVERSPGGLWRVRLGPFASRDQANSILAQVQAAGYTDARTVVAETGR